MEHTLGQEPFRISKDLFASPGQRFANCLIDYAARMMLFLIWGFMIGIYNVFAETEIVISENSSRLEDYLYATLVALIYYGTIETTTGRTLGKLATKTIVVDEFGQKPEAHKMILRALCRAIPLDALTFFGTPSRGWHDRFSDTYVVRKELLDRQKDLFYSFEEIGKIDLE